MKESKKLKIHLLSCHSILEYDLLHLFTEMGHEVFCNGAYRNPAGNGLLPRPGVANAKYFPEYEKLSAEFPKTNLPSELIEPFDIIFIMHTPEFVNENWNKIKHKKVIWYSIGQSLRHVENSIRRARYEGMKIVRYSPKEEKLPDYLGSDACIRFYKDEQEFCNWNGQVKRVINFTQSLRGRRHFCHHDEIMALVHDFPSLIYGSGNDDLGPLNGGDVPYDLMKGALRDNRVYVYGGTWPAPYTLSFIEAWMTGIPIVAIGKRLAEKIEGVAGTDIYDFYEVQDLIEHGKDGFVSDNKDELRQDIHTLLEDYELAEQVGAAGRKKAISLFGRDLIKHQWEDFFNSLH